jgi:hypothetical protein
MGYCSPIWISPYSYEKLYSRIRDDNNVAAMYLGGRAPTKPYRTLEVDGQGHVTIGEIAMLDREPKEATSRSVTFLGEDGATAAFATGLFTPYSSLPGGVVYVPEPKAAFATVRLSD